MGLTVLAAAVLLLDSRASARARPSEWCALSGWFIGFTALLGLVFGAAALYRLAHAPLIGVAPPTAVSLLLTSVGLLLERPGAGLMRVATAPGPGGVLLRRMAPATILGPALLGLVIVHVLRALGTESTPVLGALLAASTTMVGLLLLVMTAAPLNRAHEALEASRALIRDLVEQAPDGIFIADLRGQYTDVNGAGCRMLGLAREEIVGKTILDLIPRDRVEQLERERARLLRGQDVVSEWVLRKQDGTWLPVEVSAKMLTGGRWQGFVRDISERKRLEAALRVAHAHLVSAQSVAEVGSWRLDVRHNVLQWSDEEYRMFGVAPGTPMTYEAFLACVHPDDRAYVDREWTAALRGQPYDIEHRIVVDGAVRWVREKADFELGEDHALVGGIGVTLHITERIQREEKLRLSEAKAAGIVSISADAIISIDDQQRITLFNEGAEIIFGYTQAEVLGASLDILLPERFRATHRQHVERFAAGDTTARRMGERGAVILGLRKSGEEFPADAAISKLLVNGTRVLTVALRDVAEQTRREAGQRILAEAGSLLASTLELEATLTSIGQLTTRTFADFCIVYIVERGGEVRRQRAFSRDPLHGQLCEALMQLPMDRERAREIWSELAANRPVLMEHVSPEQVVAFAQGEEHLRVLRALDPRSIIMAPLFARGTLVGAMAFISRAPARGYSPADVRFADQLAQRAAYAVDNAQLYALARRAIQARDSVLGIVAHDLRSPLGTILLQASLLRAPSAGSEHRLEQRAASIERSAKRMGRMIEDLLDVTRLEEGRLSLARARVAAHQVIAESVDAQQPLAAAASLALESDVAKDLPEVWADRDRLLQVFENLIGNAMKFTGPGGLIRVGAAPKDGEVLFWVADTGAGISAENLPHVFNRFWQEWKGDRRGMGLGLAIVKGIVEAHGGRIGVESALGRGTTVQFSIPTPPRAGQPIS
jgi:PAS domain S-box-containing protein